MPSSTYWDSASSVSLLPGLPARLWELRHWFIPRPLVSLHFLVVGDDQKLASSLPLFVNWDPPTTQNEVHLLLPLHLQWLSNNCQVMTSQVTNMKDVHCHHGAVYFPYVQALYILWSLHGLSLSMLLRGSLLYDAKPTTAPINILREIYCMVCFCGIPWLQKHLQAYLNVAQDLHSYTLLLTFKKAQGISTLVDRSLDPIHTRYFWISKCRWLS